MGLVSEMVWGGQVGGLGSAAGTKWSRSVLPHWPSVMVCDHPGAGSEEGRGLTPD